MLESKSEMCNGLLMKMNSTGDNDYNFCIHVRYEIINKCAKYFDQFHNLKNYNNFFFFKSYYFIYISVQETSTTIYNNPKLKSRLKYLKINSSHTKIDHRLNLFITRDNISFPD